MAEILNRENQVTISSSFDSKCMSAYRQYQNNGSPNDYSYDSFEAVISMIGMLLRVDFHSITDKEYLDLLQVDEKIRLAIESKEFNYEKFFNGITASFSFILHDSKALEAYIKTAKAEHQLYSYTFHAIDSSRLGGNGLQEGLSPINPILISDDIRNGRTRIFLNNLQGENGENLQWFRKGSTFSFATGQPVDLWCSYTLDSRGCFPYKALYIGIYSKTCSTNIPYGFKLKKDSPLKKKTEVPKKEECVGNLGHEKANTSDYSASDLGLT